MQLRRWEQALLHLSDYDGNLFREGTLPYALTQSGVGQSLGISRSQANQILNYLETRRMVSSERHHVKGVRCMVRCYFIENRGRDEMQRICNRMDCNGRGHPIRSDMDEEDLWTSEDLAKVSDTLEALCRMGSGERWIGDVSKIPQDAANRTPEGYE